MVKPNLIDRAVGFISPEAGARRMKHRATIDILTRGYAGADRGRLKSSWRARSTSADAEIAKDGRILRDRMRDLVRNNPYAANAISVLVTHTIGDGIVPRAKDKKVNDLFSEWCRVCDADGQLDFYGIQALAMRGMFESGDGIVRRRRRRSEDGLPVPLQLQVLETDLIDSTKEGTLAGGGVMIQGIEFDAIRRKRAYWMFGSHPGNSFFDPQLSITSKAVPAEDIAHVFEKQRTQVRGAPWGAPAIADLHDLARYDQAEIVRKRLEACMVGIMTGGEIDDPVGMPMVGADGKACPPGVYNTRGERVEKFEPGMFYNAVGGKEIKFSEPAPTNSYDAYKTSALHTIAAGFRTPHALISGNLTKVNYSSSKVGLESFKRMISALQWQCAIPMLCEPPWRWFLEAAYLAGKIDHTNHPAEWSPPRMYSADPGKDIAAALAEVRAGFKPLSAVIAEGGYNPDDVLAAIARDNATLDKLGLVLDSDPRRISQAGQTQQKQADDPVDEDED